MKAVFIIISLFSSLLTASEVIKFGPGPGLVGVDSEGAHHLITGEIINGELRVALYLQNYIDKTPYADQFSVIQYKNGLVYTPSEWPEEDFNTSDQWLIAIREADDMDMEAFVEPVVNEIFPCLLSIPPTAKEYVALESLIRGRRLDDGVLTDDPNNYKLSDARAATALISQRYNQPNGCAVNDDHLPIMYIKRYLTDAVRYVLTGARQSDYLVGESAYSQMSQVFKPMLDAPVSRIKMIPIIDFLTVWSQTLLADEVPEKNYDAYLDLIILLKNNQDAIDEDMLKNIALSCLGNEISALFAKNFSLASCLNDDDLLRYDVTFKNNHYHLYMPNR